LPGGSRLHRKLARTESVADNGCSMAPSARIFRQFSQEEKSLVELAPNASMDEARRIALEVFGVRGNPQPLTSERDQNFLFANEAGERFVIRIANSATRLATLDFENRAMEHARSRMKDVAVSRLLPTREGQEVATVTLADGAQHFVRMTEYLPGVFMTDVRPRSAALLQNLGRAVAQLDLALADFVHPEMHRDFHWDLKHAPRMRALVHHIPDAAQRALVESALLEFELESWPALAQIPAQVIHNDANDANVIVSLDPAAARVTGIIDFGDMVHGPAVCDLAVAATYAMLGTPDPIETAASVVGGYHSVHELRNEEIDLLQLLIQTRLAMSVTLSAYQSSRVPRNNYLRASEAQAWELLSKLAVMSQEWTVSRFRAACKFSAKQIAPPPGAEQILNLRRAHLGPTFSISYQKPLHLVRGSRQFLFDADGHAYLDAINNVPCVGHNHPRVVRALKQQAALLNTNTRYLYGVLAEYIDRLTATLPEPLRVCFLTNSGSEANELALRLARAHTKRKDIIVIEQGYHGNTTTLVEISPYKACGAGGEGVPEFVHVAPLPDTYRGPYKGSDAAVGAKYARHVAELIERAEKSGRKIGAFLAETLPASGGMIVPPVGWLSEAYRHVRAAGGVCIADEVQVGFGRAGTHFWAFEAAEVVPDIVTMGKPIGNGHPLGAVVTTREIADSFVTGMEYFNTFGGNPVSCAVGLAVLDVLRDERLQENARVVGDYLLAGLRGLQRKFDVIGDVRGLGLFIGVELVRNRNTLEPAAKLASSVVEGMKERGVLISTEGPHHNVLKIRPPLCFAESDSERLVKTLEEALSEVGVG
jgi:4-aminobutyrate aminotransferase-like enzyme/aminoglycoside phosphotransferase (APT) family kinase protein